MKAKLVLVSLVIVVVIFVGIYNHTTPEELTIKDEYTPSQNLAIVEGRFDDARESIERVNKLSEGERIR